MRSTGNPDIATSPTACAHGRLLMPEGASNRTLDALAAAGASCTTIPYDRMHLNGGGIHCSTMPLIRDPV